MSNLSNELYLRELQNTYNKLNRVYRQLASLLDNCHDKKMIQKELSALEHQKKGVLDETLRITYTIQILKHKK